MAEFARKTTVRPSQLAQVRWRSPSVPPDTSDLDADWSDGPAPRDSFIALKEPRSLPDPTPLPLRPAPRLPTLGARSTLSPNAPLAAEVVYDVWDSPHALLVLVDLPGVDADELSLTLGSHALYLDLKIPSTAQRPGIPCGHHQLTLEMPGGLAADALDASLAHGVLRVRISKSQAGPRSVPIASSE
jgi:HSP20 family molecular chaperone IbpA